MGTVVAFCIYCLRVWMINGWYIVTYGMPSPARLSVVLRLRVCTCMNAFVLCIVCVVGSRRLGMRDRTLDCLGRCCQDWVSTSSTLASAF